MRRREVPHETRDSADSPLAHNKAHYKIHQYKSINTMLDSDNNSSGRGRRSLLLLGEKFRNSFRNSTRTLVSSQDDSSKGGDDEELALAPKHVQFPDDDESLIREIPFEDDPITVDEVQRIWYKVRNL